MSETKSTESKTDSTSATTTDAGSGYETPDENTAPVSTEPSVDENGYEVVAPEAKVETPEAKVEPEVKPEDVPVTKEATGYGEDDDKPEDKTKAPEAKEDATEDDETKLREQIIVAVHELPKEDQESISQFALDNKLSPAQVKAYAEIVKQDHIDHETARVNTKKAWMTELKTDPSFGGENFRQNVSLAEKVLEKHMPNMKKVLTERGTMLPPYIMRDLLALSKTLNPTTKLVNGEAGTVVEEKGNFLEDMYQ